MVKCYSSEILILWYFWSAIWTQWALVAREGPQAESPGLAFGSRAGGTDVLRAKGIWLGHQQHLPHMKPKIWPEQPGRLGVSKLWLKGHMRSTACFCMAHELSMALKKLRKKVIVSWPVKIR